MHATRLSAWPTGELQQGEGPRGREGIGPPACDRRNHPAHLRGWEGIVWNPPAPLPLSPIPTYPSSHIGVLTGIQIGILPLLSLMNRSYPLDCCGA